MGEPVNYNALDHYLYLTTHDDITFRVEGAQDGDFLSVVYDNDTMTFSEGAQGDVQPSQRVASLATILFTGQWGSSSNKKLAYVFNDQQNSLYLKKAQIKRINTTENVVVWDSKGAWLMKTADWAVGSEASPRAWSVKTKRTKEAETEAPT
jgi:hypothetical protein